jgi:cephalosporin hydroxylase
LEKTSLVSIQRGTLNYQYRGLPCLKNPFDLALYTLLLFQLAPKTIIEIGSAAGGSASWFSDQTKLLGLQTQILSFDIAPPKDLHVERVTFLRADVYDLKDSLLPSLLADCPRPLLVIEDGPHTYLACKSALNFLHPFMREGDYVVIEDGIVHELDLSEYKDGPNRALAEHVTKYSDKVSVDRSFCDYYGQNFTWNTNGYLRYK